MTCGVLVHLSPCQVCCSVLNGLTKVFYDVYLSFWLDSDWFRKHFINLSNKKHNEPENQ